MSEQQQSFIIKLFLSESPDSSNKEFLADAIPLHESASDRTEDLPGEIIINRYTRESWCRLSQSSGKKGESSDSWHGLWLKSIDGRRRIPGFTKFLKGRAKAAFGKFESPHPDEVTGEARIALFLVPFDQPSFPSKEILKKEGVSNVDDLIYVRYCLDERIIIRPKARPETTAHNQTTKTNKNVQQNHPSLKKTSLPPEQKVMGGLLGSLLGAQERTNRNLEAVRSKKRIETGLDTNNVSNGDCEGQPHSTVYTTSNQIIARFRSKIEEKFTRFSASSETALKIHIDHAEETRSLVSMEEKEKVTMEVLKYIVYEQSEEIGNDQWVAAKEPSEFTDDIIIAIYKAGCAPQEVLEEMNKGEIPDEARQQQRAMREALNKEEKKKAKIAEEMNMKKAFEKSQNVKRLNNVKRDRRSIEEIQRDMMTNSKRSRP